MTYRVRAVRADEYDEGSFGQALGRAVLQAYSDRVNVEITWTSSGSDAVHRIVASPWYGPVIGGLKGVNIIGDIWVLAGGSKP